VGKQSTRHVLVVGQGGQSSLRAIERCIHGRKRYQRTSVKKCSEISGFSRHRRWRNLERPGGVVGQSEAKNRFPPHFGHEKRSSERCGAPQSGIMARPHPPPRAGGAPPTAVSRCPRLLQLTD